MLKKILIAAVAVVIGTVVLTKVTKVSPLVWLKDCCNSARAMVPPEVQLKQLKSDIDAIDKDIDKNLSKLAHMDVDVSMFAEKLQANRDRVAHLRADISDMKDSLKNDTTRVVFRGHKVEADDLTRRLDMTTTEYTCLKESVKTQEAILAEKKKTLVAVKSRIREMKNAKEELRLTAVKLESYLERVKMQQLQHQVVDIDDSAVSQARQTAKDIETRLRESERLVQIRDEFGVNPKSQFEKEETKSRAEVLKAARAALQEEEQPAEVTVEKKE